MHALSSIIICIVCTFVYTAWLQSLKSGDCLPGKCQCACPGGRHGEACSWQHRAQLEGVGTQALEVAAYSLQKLKATGAGCQLLRSCAVLKVPGPTGALLEKGSYPAPP